MHGEASAGGGGEVSAGGHAGRTERMGPARYGERDGEGHAGSRLMISVSTAAWPGLPQRASPRAGGGRTHTRTHARGQQTQRLTHRGAHRSTERPGPCCDHSSGRHPHSSPSPARRRGSPCCAQGPRAVQYGPHPPRSQSSMAPVLPGHASETVFHHPQSHVRDGPHHPQSHVRTVLCPLSHTSAMVLCLLQSHLSTGPVISSFPPLLSALRPPL